MVDHEAFEAAYIRELEYYAKQIQGKYIPSIFFGGGTPSLMKPSLVAKIIDKIREIGIIDQNTEITLEANPTSSEAQKFKDFHSAGVNRLSIGVQSLRADDLKALGREHSASQARAAIEMARNSFSRLSFDLIYARPNQTMEAWQNELQEAISIAGSHLSLYQLTIEKGTPFYKLHRDGKLITPENDLAADMYLWTNDYLKDNGFGPYEISNYAKPSQECRHNLVYWNYDEYLGIGPGAHSRLHDAGVRALMNWHKPEKWAASALESGRGLQKEELLTEQELIGEILMMGLRLESGIGDNALRKLVGKGFDEVLNMDAIGCYIDSGFAQMNLGKLRLTHKGLLMHSYIVPRLINIDGNKK
jgi:oxygen-independent coproporphyrinogen-3 oxidase